MIAFLLHCIDLTAPVVAEIALLLGFLFRRKADSIARLMQD
jgi:hypothetical protein